MKNITHLQNSENFNRKPNEASNPSSDAVIRANIALHTRLADEYGNEPHFRPESIARVEKIVVELAKRTNATHLLDLGCGTGFMISIAKKYVQHIVGVDVTPAMLAKVDRSGSAIITVHEHDTGTFAPNPAGGFDLVTAYSFLHHLFDIRPTLRTAYNALRPGGIFYADLEPNAAFWSGITQLDRHALVDPIVQREIEMVAFKDEDIEKTFGVSKETFNAAEFGKTTGGLNMTSLKCALENCGFKNVSVFYHWFIGQGAMINDPEVAAAVRTKNAEAVDQLLRRVMPLSVGLFKYLGFTATK